MKCLLNSLIILIISQGISAQWAHPDSWRPEMDSLEFIYKQRIFKPDGVSFSPGMVLSSNKLPFEKDGHKLEGESISFLDSVAYFLRYYPKIRLGLRYNLKDQASADSDKGLDRRRAISVREYLVKKGIAAGRLRILNGGAEHPIFPEKWLKTIPDVKEREEVARKNERMEFIILHIPFE
jgi:outer membrane protein OmpA-like peptidoglycan-associated protein